MIHRVITNFFRRAPLINSIRTFSSEASYNALQYNHYFVDSNVIIGYRLEQYKDLTAFIEKADKRFHYTETVLQELQAKTGSFRVAEADPNDPNCKFSFIDSGISSDWKNKSINLLFDMWDEQFKTMKPNVRQRLGYELTARQREGFKSDLKIIIEASAVCHKPGILPDDELRTPPLLTNNMMLWKKFISQRDREELLETAINLTGHEHLLPVLLLQDVLESFQDSLSDAPSQLPKP